MQEIEQLIVLMMLEEKAALCSALDSWHVQGLERLGIPSTMIHDGPRGPRKQLRL